MSYDFSPQEFISQAGNRLFQELPDDVFDLTKPVITGDDLRPFEGAKEAGLIIEPERVRLASVLVPLLKRRDGLHVLLTKRSDELPVHAGQISFPGGKIEKGETPLITALRETREEVGIKENFIDIKGYLPAYQTFTGFRIIPVIAFLEEGYELKPEAGEVAEIFDVPLSFVMNERNHQKHRVENSGVRRHYYAISYKDYFIWGATAGILRQLYRQVYQP